MSETPEDIIRRCIMDFVRRCGVDEENAAEVSSRVIGSLALFGFKIVKDEK